MSTLSSRRRLTTGGALPDSHHKLSRSTPGRRADGTTRRLTTSLEGGANIDDSFQQELQMVYTTSRRGNNNTNINSMNAIEIDEDPRYHGPPSRNNNNRWRGIITCKATSYLPLHRCWYTSAYPPLAALASVVVVLVVMGVVVLSNH